VLDGLAAGQASLGVDLGAAIAPVEPVLAKAVAEPAAVPERLPAPMSFWVGLASCAVALAIFYAYFSFARLEIFKMLLGSFFPLANIDSSPLPTITGTLNFV
jgi:hypothetical protein